MTERSFFDFGSRSGDFERLESAPWVMRFQDLAGSVDSVDENVIEATFDEDTLPTHGEIIELIETMHAGESSPFIERAATERAHQVHLPEHYEARYAYPLVVWFHGEGSSEAEIHSIMSGISERNFIGLAIRGNVNCDSKFGWSISAGQLETLSDDVESLVRGLRRTYHIHSERIFLAGYGSGASAAMSLMLHRPEWFGGAACLCGKYTDLQVPESQYGELQNKRMMLATSVCDRLSGVRDVVTVGQMLYASGMQIGTRVYQDAGTSPTKKMLQDLNLWFMDDVCSMTP
ncbi:alpha/beta hydrolase [Schlesneria paludicola]|uniref:alpha/beta hydrolase n=1 Tax=Schlesneria paludicola TaxID=360056 RepID=UPI00029B26A9|nr:alpha/beta hydrolase-fold protein [Schlesneria paludicola]